MVQQLATDARHIVVAAAFSRALTNKIVRVRYRRCRVLNRRGDHVEKPLRRDGEGVGAVDGPAIAAAARVQARRGNDITAVAAHIDARCKLAGGIADFSLGPSKEEMWAACGNALDGGRQCTVLVFELLKLGLGVDIIDVDDHDAGCRAGSDANIAGRGLTPATADDVRIA